jgi:hypothetical protein
MGYPSLSNDLDVLQILKKTNKAFAVCAISLLIVKVFDPLLNLGGSN